jgi:hypothetical protein
LRAVRKTMTLPQVRSVGSCAEALHGAKPLLSKQRKKGKKYATIF